MCESVWERLARMVGERGGSTIAEALIDSCESQQQCAELIGCSCPSVKKWAAGRPPGDRYLPKILELSWKRSPEKTRKVLARESLQLQSICRQRRTAAEGRRPAIHLAMASVPAPCRMAAPARVTSPCLLRRSRSVARCLLMVAPRHRSKVGQERYDCADTTCR